jgi:hypothetical protein
MTRGNLIFSHNNRSIDYGKIALANACLIKKYMTNNHVTLITDTGTVEWLYKTYDEDFVKSKIENIIVTKRRNINNTKRYYDTSYSKTVEKFYNINRFEAFNLSPYDETLLIDADYLIGNNNLDQCWELEYDLQINNESRDIMPSRIDKQFEKLDDRSIDFYWATAVFFRKTKENELFFDTIKHIYRNWNYYSMLYDFISPNFRNDHAFSIAVHIMNGMNRNNFVKPLPVPFLQHSIGADDVLECTNGNQFKILIEKPNQRGNYVICKIEDTNIHIMNKFALNRIAGSIIEQNK